MNANAARSLLVASLTALLAACGGSDPSPRPQPRFDAGSGADAGSTDGGDAGANDGGETNDGGSCPGGQTSCEGACRELSADPEHCGTCGNACGAGSVCLMGQCQATCGDGALDSGEACDDQNSVSGDGCSSACALESGYTCTGTPSVCKTTCGDSVLAGMETCDDGNAFFGDGCSAACAIEDGYTCSGTPSACVAVCGDGVLRGAETCDDGNAQKGDGCSDTCQSEAGFICNDEPSLCEALCADGLIRGPETCDDDNAAIGDGCSNTCTVESGYACSGEPSVCATVCGDGQLAGAESCDDQNTSSGDGCSAACAIESGYSCTGLPSACSTVCGDAQLAGAEVCDDGNPFSGDGCSATCTIEPGFTCTGSVSVCTTQCGDGIPAGSEACDDQDTTSGDGCSATCAVEPGYSCSGAPSVCVTGCGDGLIAGSETCDDGNTNSGDGCSGICAVEPGYSCSGQPTSCTTVCGDGLLAGTETCDDGNTTAGDGCAASCAVESGFTCTGEPSVCTAACGDGTLSSNEACDDGNTSSGDCCSATCTVEPGCEVEPNNALATANAFSAVSVSGKVKGFVNPPTDFDLYSLTVPANGEILAETQAGPLGTQCTSNQVDTYLTLRDSTGAILTFNNDIDFATNRCSQLASGTLLAGQYFLEVRRPPSGGLINDYSLSVTIKVPVCGNGEVEFVNNERCDDGNTASGDGCSPTCTWEVTPESEPNNVSTAANLVTVGRVHGGSITPVGDLDWYKFVVPATADVHVETFDADGPSSCVGVDTTVSLIGTNGSTVLATDNDSGFGACSRIDGVVTPAARKLPAGTYYVRVGENGNNGTIASYTLRVRLTAVCGDGVIQGSEECDGQSFCDPITCDRTVTCGDGYIDGAETCDDGDTMSGDGCSATCAIEALAEVEPNNSKADADARAMGSNPVLISGSRHVAGAIGSAGDADVFKLNVTTPGAVRFETHGGTLGQCPSGMATTLMLLDAAGNAVVTDQDSGVGGCSAIVYYLSAGTWYVRVEEQGNNAALASYTLDVVFEADGGSEVEPNNLRTSSSAVSGEEVYVFGGHQSGSDADWFAITVAPGKGVRAETIEGSGAETCESNGIDTRLTLFDSAGVELESSDDSGRGFCSMFDGTGAVPAYVGASKLQGGTYYLRVDASPAALGAAAQFDYRLVITIR